MRIAISFFALLWTFSLNAQQLSHAALIDSILATNPDFEVVNEYLRPIRRDSNSLNYLLEQARLLNQCTAEAYAVDLLGKAERNASRFTRAQQLHTEAYRIAQRCNDSTMMATALNGRGVVFRRQDYVAEAIEAHSLALELAEQAVNQSFGLKYAEGVALNSLGNIYLAMERWPEATDMFLKSMVLQDSLGNPLGVAINNQNLGYVAVETKDFDKALQYFEKSLEINKTIKSDFGIVLSKIAIADLYARTDRVNEAYQLMNSVMPVVKTLGDPYHEAQAYNVYGKVLTGMGRITEAEQAINAALQVALTHDFGSHQVTAYELLAGADSLRGDFRSALGHVLRSQAVERELFSQRNQRYVGGLSNTLESTRQRAEIDRLAQENELVKERSRRDRILLIALLSGFVFLAGLLFILYRQRKIIDDRNLAHLEQQRLASQMNPHFLFNALNSIKAFLIDNERNSAIRYLDSFAQLVRRILNSSVNETVSLREEIENCKLYALIENARLNNEVDFTIDVDRELRIDDWRIPPLLLQPFLENAFWHGLQSKDGAKKLDLKIASQAEDKLTITIRDNGVGRVVADRNKTGRAMQRQSLGIEITRRRLSYYAKETGKKADFKTVDLIAPDGEALGTEVIIEIG